MADALIESYAWDLADCLGIKLKSYTGAPKLRGQGELMMDFDGQKVKFAPVVLSSYASRDCQLVLARLAGNLAALASVTNDRTNARPAVKLALIDLAKIGGKAAGYLERERPENVPEALLALGAAVVKRFDKVGKNEWALAA